MNYTYVNEVNQTKFNSLLYASFSDQTNSWVMKNYQADHINKSLSPGINRELIDHYRTESYLFYKDNKIVSGITFNLNNFNNFQLEKMGFIIPDWIKKHSCEILNFFILCYPRSSPFRIGKQVAKVEQNILTREDYTDILATCPDKLLNFYSRFGWKKIDELVQENNKNLNLIQYSRQ